MTIGYEGLASSDFFAVLAQCKVQTLIDVREMPLSRKKGFSKTGLCEALTAQGIAYKHIPALGCPKPVRYDYRENGDWKLYTSRFMEYLKTQGAVLSELASTVQNERCCLMCFEENYNFCHRRYIAEELVHFLERPYRINHLTGPMAGRIVVPALLAAA